MLLTWLSNLADFSPTLGLILVGLLFFAVTVWLLLKLINLRWQYKRDVVFLELTPHAWTDRLPEATEQLFNALHGMSSPRKLVDRMLRREHSLALEIVSSRTEGIRYLLRVPDDMADGIEQVIASYIPDAKVKRGQGYFKGDLNKNSRIVSFRQSGHFAFPLKNFDSLAQQDPIGYLTNAMTKLGDDELMSLQLVITPADRRAADKIGYQILSNEDLLSKLDKRRAPLRPRIFGGINSLLFSLLDGVSSIFHSNSSNTYYGSKYYSMQRELEQQKQVSKRLKPARQLSYFEQELVESIHDKLSRPLFNAEVRLLIDSKTKDIANARKRNVVSALNLLAVPKYQQLKPRRFKYSLLRKVQQFSFMYRLPAILQASNVLSTSELASLFHFPHSKTAKTENVVKSLSKTLPAPLSRKNGTDLDVMIGANVHQGTITPIGLTADERQRHAYIIGGTGNGKTTMLQYAIIQDIHNGKGVAVIDPHGDMSETLLKHIPESRMKDVVYFHPYDIDYPIGLNLMELPEGLSKSELLVEKDFVTEAIVSVFRKTFSDDDSGGHRIEYILRNAIRTAFTVEGSTIFTLFDLLTDSEFRNKVTDKLEDKRLKNFWKQEFGKAGAMQRVKLGQGVTTKIGRFDGSEQVKRVMEQSKSTIDFDDILDSGKILICNFAKGELGEDTSELFGISVLAKLQLSALRRARQKEANRKPYYLYVDEFQNFATMSFVQLLSEARKYKLFLTMAEQSTSQQDEQRLIDIILANVGTVICFRSGSPADERYVLPLFKPYLEEGEIANLSAYTFYMRIAAVDVQEPLSGVTVLLDNEGSEKVAEQVKQYSRAHYANEYLEVKEQKPEPKQEAKAEPKQQQQTKKETPKPKPQKAIRPNLTTTNIK